MAIIDDRTAGRNYALPNAANKLKDDVARLRSALSGVDTDVVAILLALAGKAEAAHAHGIADITGLVTALNGKIAVGYHDALDDLADVSVTGAANGQVLIKQGTQWIPINLQVGNITNLETLLNSKATLADITAAVNGIVGAAPGALDTLIELATALGNDPNFATTMTNALALKAPLASPALTGTPTAPTAALGDNSTKIATTGFIKRILSTPNFRLSDGADQTKLVAFDASPLTTATTRTLASPDFSGYLSVSAKGADMPSAATLLIAASSGDFFHITGTTAITSLGTGQAGIERTLVFDGSLTLTHNSASLILPGAANILTTTGDVATFRSEGSSGWRLVKYERNAQFLSGNLTGTGYVRLPNGLIFQWGNLTVTGGATFLSFPTAFPSACFTAVGTAISTADINCTTDTTGPSGTNFRTWNTAGVATGSNVRWIAIGI